MTDLARQREGEEAVTEQAPYDPGRTILAGAITRGLVEATNKYPAAADPDWLGRWLSGYLGSYAFHAETYGHAAGRAEALREVRERVLALPRTRTAADDPREWPVSVDRAAVLAALSDTTETTGRKCGSCGKPGHYAGDRTHPCTTEKGDGDA